MASIVRPGESVFVRIGFFRFRLRLWIRLFLRYRLLRGSGYRNRLVDAHRLPPEHCKSSKPSKHEQDDKKRWFHFVVSP